MGKWDVALEELNTLCETPDVRARAALIASSAAGVAKPSSHVEPSLGILHSRTWLVNWSSLYAVPA